MVPQGPCQMDRDTTPAPRLGALSHTPVTQGTGGLQVVLVEHVSQMANGQGVIQLVHVSPHYVNTLSIASQLTTIKHAKELLAFFSMHNDPDTPVNAGTPKDTLSITLVMWDSSSLELLP